MTSLAFCIAEQRGFRVFDESILGTASADPTIPSPLEVMTLLAGITIGVASACVFSLASLGWVIRRATHAFSLAWKEAGHPDPDSAHVQNAGCRP